MPFDVVIVGGGPAGLSAALALGRARTSVLLCDAGPRRNATAEQVHNFVTRDGTPPDEFRRIAREQLAAYPSVDVRDAAVQSVAGEKGNFRVVIGADTVEARRILVCTGMLDELPAIEGLPELWGHAVFQCPYCHGWEAKDLAWGYLVRPEQGAHVLPFALRLRSWSRDVTLFTNGELELPEEERRRLRSAEIRIETLPVARLMARAHRLEAIELEGGTLVRCEALFVHPPQRQVSLVQALGLALDDDGYVQVDPMKRETSVPGVFAAGDLTTRMQSAIIAAAAGMHAAAALHVDLVLE
ncbi:MAG TPA: NAD(P)/FAD-dependent oxidoreductase [Polyangiaceae bacterium]